MELGTHNRPLSPAVRFQLGPWHSEGSREAEGKAPTCTATDASVPGMRSAKCAEPKVIHRLQGNIPQPCAGSRFWLFYNSSGPASDIKCSRPLNVFIKAKMAPRKSTAATIARLNMGRMAWSGSTNFIGSRSMTVHPAPPGARRPQSHEADPTTCAGAATLSCLAGVARKARHASVRRSTRFS